jgi:cytoskeletal protein RodZ
LSSSRQACFVRWPFRHRPAPCSPGYPRCTRCTRQQLRTLVRCRSDRLKEMEREDVLSGDRRNRRPPTPIASPQRTVTRIRRLTTSIVVAVTGAVVLIGAVVAREHPGSAKPRVPENLPATAPTSTTLPQSSTTTTNGSDPTAVSTVPPTTTTVPPTETTEPPTTTTTRPAVTSGGTSR